MKKGLVQLCCQHAAQIPFFISCGRFIKWHLVSCMQEINVYVLFETKLGCDGPYMVRFIVCSGCFRFWSVTVWSKFPVFVELILKTASCKWRDAQCATDNLLVILWDLWNAM